MGSVAKELDEDLAAVLDEDRQKGRLFEEASLTRHGCTLGESRLGEYATSR